MSNKRYADEFKIEAVKQVTKRGTRSPMFRAGWAFLSTACTSGLSASAYRRPSGPRPAVSKKRCGSYAPSSSE